MQNVIRDLQEGPRWSQLRPFRRHSMVLIVAGLVYIAIGITYLQAEPTPERLNSLQYATDWLEYNTWGYVFIFVGLLAVISSRWPPFSETWGYFVLTGQSAAWAGFYLAGIVFSDTGVTYLSAVLSWGLIGFMWWAISALQNPEVLEVLFTRILELQSENLALHDEIHRLRANQE